MTESTPSPAESSGFRDYLSDVLTNPVLVLWFIVVEASSLEHVASFGGGLIPLVAVVTSLVGLQTLFAMVEGRIRSTRNTALASTDSA